MRNILVASCSLDGSLENPGAKIIIKMGARITAARVTKKSTKVSVPAIRFMKILVFSISCFCLYSDNMGTKACEKAPSANSLLRKLGILKATRNASM